MLAAASAGGFKKPTDLGLNPEVEAVEVAAIGEKVAGRVAAAHDRPALDLPPSRQPRIGLPAGQVLADE
jgi:hypothetical protein